MILNHKIKKSADFVFDHLTDFEKFVSIHPIIFKMDDLGNGNYKVYEKLGFISFTYSATVIGDPQTKTVNIKAVIMKVTKVEMNFSIKAEGDHSHIHETITFRSPLPIKSFMQSVFKKQHKQLFLNIEKV